MNFKILALVALMTVNAHAIQPLLSGVDSSGGGNAVVCRDSKGKVKSAEVLDLFEARILYRRKIIVSKEHRIFQANQRVSPLYEANNYGFGSLMGNLSRVMKIAHILPAGVALQPINDTFSPVMPKNCKIEQLAAYQINNELYIDGEIWGHLDMTNKAALYAHEAIYKTLRESGAHDSIRARKLVGLLFSDKVDLKPVLDANISNDKLSFCSSGGDAPATLHARYVGDKVELSFIALAGQPVASKKMLELEAGVFRNPNPLNSITFVNDPWNQREFEADDEFRVTALPDRIVIQARGEFGDESLHHDYAFIGCQPFEP